MKLNPYVMVTGSCRLQVATSDSLGIFHALLPTIKSSEIFQQERRGREGCQKIIMHFE